MATETRQVVIEGNLARMERKIIEREFTTEDLMAQIGKTLAFDSGPLPQGGAYLRGADTEGRPVQLFVIERPPSPFGMSYRVWKNGDNRYDSRDDRENIIDLALSWPRTLWCYKFVKEAMESVHLAGLDAPLMDRYRESKVTTLLVPNVHSNGNGAFCTGQIAIPMDLVMPKRIAWLHNHLQGSTWNADLHPPYPSRCGITGLFDWHKKTEADRDYWKKIKFPTHQMGTVGGLFDHLMRRPV